MPWELGFILREELKQHIKATIKTYAATLKSIDLKKFNKNIIDPIKLTFDSKVYKKSLENSITDEISRQRDKTNSNAIGYFHQNIFKYINNCEVPTKGFDVIFKQNVNTTWFVEIKNKHNTMNSKSSQSTYLKLLAQISKSNEYKCALVEVIAKKSQDIVWKIPIDSEQYKNERIKRISIDRFYTMVTGDNAAFKKLCGVLPVLIDEIIDENDNYSVEIDTVLIELRGYNPDLLKALYKLAFNTYESFEF